MRPGLALVIALLFGFTGLDTALAQSSCPPEVEQAQKMLSALGAQKPSRAVAGARGQDVQAPRGQDVQAPRGQDVQAPRAAAKSRAAMLDTAGRLVREVQGACKAGDDRRASANARAALELLNYLQ